MRLPIDILLVDDEPRNLDVLEAILADPSYRLLRAVDADGALRLLLDHDVAAIILDIKMPGVSGFELARIIKDTRRFRETPIVFLSAYMVDDQDVITGYGAGGVDYLTKPVNPQILRHKIAVFADLYRKTRELAEVNAQLASLNEKLEMRVKERTAKLESSEAALRAAAHQKDEFLAVLAHELRNPLAPLRMGLDLLLRHQAIVSLPPVTRTLARMSRQLDHLVRLIDDLLDVSRISRGLLELKRDHVDLAAVVRSAVESARPWFEQRSQTISVEIPDEVRAYADETRVAQIVTNLLHNAAKFTPDGGSIRVELARDADTALVQVIDSGTGILPDQLDRMFDMFARIERPGANSQLGLGIGLALSRRLAEMHGGTLAASSDGEGRGATFSLRIPASKSTALASSVHASSPPSKTGTELSVVVVEDNEDVADGLVDWLEDLGHRVSVAHTGERGVEAIEDVRPDVVLCDLGLPGMDGLDVCRRVRTFPREAQPVMVALTGWGREEDVRRSKEAGFDHHLVKPPVLDKLQAILHNISESRAQKDSPLQAVDHLVHRSGR